MLEDNLFIVIPLLCSLVVARKKQRFCFKIGSNTLEKYSPSCFYSPCSVCGRTVSVKRERKETKVIL